MSASFELRNAETWQKAQVGPWEGLGRGGCWLFARLQERAHTALGFHIVFRYRV